MYYIELIKRFWEFNHNNSVGSGAVAMYFYLLKLGHENDSYEVRVSDVFLSKELAMTRKTIKSTKDKMKAYGLIDFSTRNGAACTYRILLNYSVQKYSGAEITGHEPAGTEVIDDEANSFQYDADKPDDVDDQKISEILKAIPPLTEFMEFARTLSLYRPTFDSILKERYDLWKSNGWRSSSDRPIANWRSTLKSVLPYLSVDLHSKSGHPINIPKIERP